MNTDGIRTLLFQVELERKRLLQPFFLEIGLTVGQGQPRILKTLLEHGPMTQRELADLCRLDVTTMSRTLDRLSEAGLLKRTRKEQSRRANSIELTPLGREKALLVKAGFAKLNEIIGEGLSEKELEELGNGLEKIRENIQKAQKQKLTKKLVECYSKENEENGNAV